jgi:thioredoxin-dependent peroxiredoxin
MSEPIPPQSVGPQVGAPAPTFRLPSSTGDPVDLAELVSRGPVVLFFYPRANTPGCTKEACGFRDDIREFRKAGIAVIGISPDPPKAVRKFAQKFDLDYPLLADEDHSVAGQYGLWQQKSMYGLKYMGVVRTTVLMERGGKILHVFEKVKPQGHSREVLDWLRSNRR